MRTLVSNALLRLAALAVPVALYAQPPATVQVVHPEKLDYRADPNVPGVGIAVVAGDPKTGPYTIRARFAPHTQAAPHRHPDTRTVTVLGGFYYFAEGAQFDAAKLRPFTPGTVLVVPAGTPHFSAAGEVETVVQESGVGPTRLELMQPSP
ncbi:cupin domain-containing protein [Fontimonas sp. SYSU GA230001]|uniref:cupin domain-containing protein n=1 Tax=Fontimonas sp. SYSU GA230001 TaxID=3142450 RepID=UPI0032B38B60